MSRICGVACRPLDFVAHPTIAGFAQYLSQLLDPEVPGTPSSSSPSPLVTLRDSGAQPPLCCIHASGGQVTAYLRLGALLGDQQPLYAIQSRGLDNVSREHASVESMATDYATIIQSLPHPAPYRLLGWSMGGIVAHAVAEELERRGALVDRVGLIDPVNVARSISPVGDVAFALAAIIHDAQREAPDLEVLCELVGACASDANPRAALLKQCHDIGLIPRCALSLDQFNASIDLYVRHFAVLRRHRPGVVSAPVYVWRAGGLEEGLDLRRLSRSTVTVKAVGGTHFSIIRPPYIEPIAREFCGLPSVF